MSYQSAWKTQTSAVLDRSGWQEASSKQWLNSCWWFISVTNSAHQSSCVGFPDKHDISAGDLRLQTWSSKHFQPMTHAWGRKEREEQGQDWDIGVLPLCHGCIFQSLRALLGHQVLVDTSSSSRCCGSSGMQRKALLSRRSGEEACGASAPLRWWTKGPKVLVDSFFLGWNGGLFVVVVKKHMPWNGKPGSYTSRKNGAGVDVTKLPPSRWSLMRYCH